MQRIREESKVQKMVFARVATLTEYVPNAKLIKRQNMVFVWDAALRWKV